MSKIEKDSLFSLSAERGFEKHTRDDEKEAKNFAEFFFIKLVVIGVASSTKLSPSPCARIIKPHMMRNNSLVHHQSGTSRRQHKQKRVSLSRERRDMERKNRAYGSRCSLFWNEEFLLAAAAAVNENN
jgi:hypothetical protein